MKHGPYIIEHKTSNKKLFCKKKSFLLKIESNTSLPSCTQGGGWEGVYLIN